MANAQTQMLMSYLEAKGMHARQEDGDIVRAGWKLDNTELSLYFDLSKEGYVSIIGHDFIKVADDKFDKIIWAINDANAKYSFVKFVLNKEENEILLMIDAVVQLDSCAEETFELMVRSAQIVDDAYPELMKAMWA